MARSNMTRLCTRSLAKLLLKTNHRIKGLTVGKKHLKAEKQPLWLVAAIRRTIVDLPGGYEEAAEILGLYKADDVTPSADTLHNRLRNGGDQIFPLWWALLLQSASGTHYVTDAIARHSGGVFVPLVEVEDIDNADINQRLMETIEWISEHSQYVRIATADGVIDADERERIEENSYKVMAKWQEHLTLLYRVFCAPEKGDARECAAPGVVAHSNRVEN